MNTSTVTIQGRWPVSDNAAGIVRGRKASPESKPDNRLASDAQAGDRDAFVELIKQYDGSFRAVAFSMMGNASEMDDVLQESYLKAFRSIGSFKVGNSFKPWMASIIHNTAIDELRKRRSNVISIHEHDDETELRMPGQSSANYVAGRMDINSALAQLSNAHRAVVLLVDGEGYDYASAGKILGVPAGTVSSRVSQARSTLRTLLETSYKDTK